MIKNYTKEKEKIVLRRFHQLLRSGKDYSTNYMYAEAGKKAFLASKRAGDIVRKHYKNKITESMCGFVLSRKDVPRVDLVAMVSKKFALCERESRLIIRYIWRKK